MTELFIYNSSKGVLRQKAILDQPKNYTGHPENGQAIKKYLDDLKEYEKHIAGLKSFPAPNGFIEDGRELVEGVDFEIVKQVLSSEEKHTPFGSKYNEVEYEKRAVPIPKEAPVEDQEAKKKYWKDVVRGRIDYFRKKYHTYEANELQAALDTIDRLVPPLNF